MQRCRYKSMHSQLSVYLHTNAGCRYILLYNFLLSHFLSFLGRIQSFCGYTRFSPCPRLRWKTQETSSCHCLFFNSFKLSLWSTTMPSTGTSLCALGPTTTAQGHWVATMICCTSTAERSSPVQVHGWVVKKAPWGCRVHTWANNPKGLHLLKINR